jgi:hypothetical protein
MVKATQAEVCVVLLPAMVSAVVLEENAIVSSVEFLEGSGGGASTVIGQFVGAEMTKVRRGQK